MMYNTPEMEIMQLDVREVITQSPFGDAGTGTPSGEPEIKPGIGDNWD